ncbi:hypothetical protein ACJJTC_006098 [Scirpophaga incertulas]
MDSRRQVATLLCLCLLQHAFSLPTGPYRTDAATGNQVSARDDNLRRMKREDTVDNLDISNDLGDGEGDDDDDDDIVSSEVMQSSPTGGSSLFSLLRLASSLFPASMSNTPFLWNVLSEVFGPNGGQFLLRRKDVADNEIEIDEVEGLKPPPQTFQRQETEEDSSESSEDGTEESLEDTEDSSGQDSENASNSSDDEDDEPPEGDGGGILGILAGLSGGEDGQSDLGSLLATISGIVVNLSGDGIDVNSLIASGLGLFVGLLSEGEENPGSVIASYLLTSLDSLTGGGAQNNGAFFGNLVSKLVKGTSAAGEEDDGSDESGDNGNKMADSAGFFLSLIMSLLGDMSKTSSSGSSQPSKRYGQIVPFYRAELYPHRQKQ